MEQFQGHFNEDPIRNQKHIVPVYGGLQLVSLAHELDSNAYLVLYAHFRQYKSGLDQGLRR